MIINQTIGIILVAGFILGLAGGCRITPATYAAENEVDDAEVTKSSRDGIVEKLTLPLRLTAIISTTATAVIWSKYSRTHRDYMNAKDIDKIREYYDQSNKYYKLRNGLIITTGILWGANLVTLWLKPPAENVDEFESSLSRSKNERLASGRWEIHPTGKRVAFVWSTRF